MTKTAVIIDNLLNPDDLKNIQDKVESENTMPTYWYDISQQHDYFNLCHLLLITANNHYDLSDVIGYEFWGHKNTRPPGGWHYDKDEIAFHRDGIYKFPVCSIIYYPVIENLIGGELILNKDVITPRTNRLIIFKSGVYHYVNEFEGKRYSLLINPWTHKLTSVSE